MGTWIGHIAPGILKKIYLMFIIDFILGVFFILFALWWHINNCIRYLKSLANVTDEETKQQDKLNFKVQQHIHVIVYLVKCFVKYQLKVF